MIQKLRNRDEGFTIIEVLIVLAIAGLILLIVFLAVPALQRNARNTNRKSDVAKLLGAVAEYTNNNNGGTPATCSGTSPVTIGAAPATIAQTNVGYYNLGCAAGAAAVSGHAGVTAAPGAPFTNPATAASDYVTIYTGATCNGNAVQGGSARSVAAAFEIETGNNAYAPVCQSE